MNILFVHGSKSNQKPPFIQIDFDIIQDSHNVQEFSLPDKHLKQNPLISPSAWKAVRQSDFVFGWFGGTAHFAILARLLRRPSILVIGGADVVDLPEIRYGLGALPQKRRSLILLGYRCATCLLAFSDSSRSEVSARLPGSNSKLKTLHLAVDTEWFSPEGEKYPQVLTVGYIKRNNLERKGINTFIEAARLLPQTHFRLAGVPVEADVVKQLLENSPTNFAYLGGLTPEVLRSEYRKSKVYAQLSLHEGFGMSLVEAMACGCIPVVTNRGSLPEVVGDSGLYVPTQDAQATAQAIKQALQENSSKKAEYVRERVTSLFPLSKRKDGLNEVIHTVSAQYGSH